MKKWHVNNKGNAGRCGAEKGGCPFGEQIDHYDTKAEALYAYETKKSDETFSNTLTKKTRIGKNNKQKMYKFVAIGGVALSSVSLVGCESDISINDQGDVEVTVEGEEYTIETDTEEPETEGTTAEPTEAETSSEEESNEESSTDPSTVNPDSVLWMGEDIYPSSEEVNEAKAQLNELVVVDELDRPDYDRQEMFGGFKSGVVESIQLRDLPNAEFGDNAKAAGGYMMDPYTGDRIELSSENTSDIDTEHIIALKEVVESERIVINTDSEAEAIKEDTQLLRDYVSMGESNLTEEEIAAIESNPENLDHYYLDDDAKKEIANSEDNLTMVSSSANRSKGDQDAGDWLIPDYEPAQCTYIVSAIKVKTNFGLSVDELESNAMRDTLENKCD